MSEKHAGSHHHGSHSGFSGDPLHQVLIKEEEAAAIVRKVEEEEGKIIKDAHEAAQKKIAEREQHLEKTLSEVLQKEKKEAQNAYFRDREETEASVAKVLAVSPEQKKKAVTLLLEEMKHFFSA